MMSASFLATGVYNLESSRFRSAPLDERSEGWTEQWGANDLADSSFWNIDKESISLLLATPHPQLPIVLTQYRPVSKGRASATENIKDIFSYQ